MKTTRILLAVFTVLLARTAAADWALVGAGYLCDKNKFALQSTVESSGGNIPLPTNFTSVPEGEHTVVCNLGGSSVEAHIAHYPPSPTGWCGTAGLVSLEQVKVRGKDYLPVGGGMMLFYCGVEPSYTRVEYFAKSKELKVCKGMWNWGDSFDDETCEIIKTTP